MLRNACARLYDSASSDVTRTTHSADAVAGCSSAPGKVVRLTLPSSVGDDVTLWQVTQPGDNSALDAVNVLTADDWAEFAPLRNKAVRKRAFAVRTILRRLLSDATGGAIEPGAWRFARSPFGKPYVVPGLPQIDFSVSHTEGVSLIAIAPKARLGLDVEAFGIADWHAAASDAFSPRELSQLRRTPQALREEAFLRIWTAREAYAKLVGIGLSADLPANDCGVGTQFATWSAECPSGRMVVSLAIDGSQGDATQPG